MDQSEPFFYIETCSNCASHAVMFGNQHSEKKYIQFADDLKTKIQAAIPEAKVLINQYVNPNPEHRDMCAVEGSLHDMDILSRATKGRSVNNILSGYDTLRYGFEVYFMGVRMYSKIVTRLWPNNTLLLNKLVRAWGDHKNGQSILDYEYISKKKQQDGRNTTQFFSQGDGHSRYGSMDSRMPMSASTVTRPRPRGKLNTSNYNTTKPPASAPQMQKFTVRGRKICVAECKFVFDRVWGTTCDHQHKENEEHGHEHHSGGVKSKHEVMLTDFFHIIHYSGILLNKASPDDDDTAPFEHFMKYARKEFIALSEGEEK